MAKSRTNVAHKSLVDIKTKYKDTYVNKEGKSAVSLYLYLKRKRVIFKTSVYVAKKDWDYENEKVKIKGDKKNTDDLNMIIDSCKSRINDIFIKYKLQHQELTPELLKREYEIKTTYVDFYSWVDNAIKERKGILAHGTYMHHISRRNKLKEYKKKLTFAEIDERFITKYKLHLVRTKLAESTIHDQMKFLKTYLTIAVKDGMIEKNPFKTITLKRPNHAERIFLTPEELNKLITLYKNETLKPSFHKSLRHFLFGCFTGLRISDVKRLKMEMIINNTIVFVPHKTKNVTAKIVRVPLTKAAKKLIKDESPNRLKGPVFNMWTEQVINRHLKDHIIKAAEIDKQLTFHSSRHTFATIFLRETKNLLALKELLGHSRIQDTMVYSHLIPDDLVNEMKTFDKFKL